MSEMQSAGPLTPEPPSAPEEPRPKRAVPEDLQTPWGWGELFLFLAVAFLSLLVATFLMSGAAMLWWHVKPADLQKLATTNGSFASILMAIWYTILLCYLAATVRIGHHLPFWRTIGWRRLREGKLPQAARLMAFALGGVLMAMVVGMISVEVRTKANLPMEELFQNRMGILWLMAIGILVAPAAEETLFRGYLYPVLARALGVEGGILVTGLLFGALHARQLWGGWGQIALITLVGIVLTYVRARTGTVLASWLLHFGYNTFIFATFYVSTGGLRHLPPVH